MIKSRAIDMLLIVKETLDNLNATFWLDMGTLLGVFRDQRIIPSDGDVDLGMMRSENIEAVCKKFHSMGCEVILYSTKIRINGKFPVDIYIYNDKEDVAERVGGWYRYTPRWSRFLEKAFPFRHFLRLLYTEDLNSATSSNSALSSILLSKFLSVIPYKIRLLIFNSIDRLNCRHYTIVVPIKHYTNFGKIRFAEHNFRIPNDIEEYLEKRYGLSWRVPDSKWDFVSQVETELSTGIIDKKRTVLGPRPQPIQVWKKGSNQVLMNFEDGR